MRDYGTVRSTVRPEPVKIDEFSVWRNSNIHEVAENVGEENEFVGWEYDMVRYDKNEFIKLQAAESERLAEQITNIQLALCRLYEKTEV